MTCKTVYESYGDTLLASPRSKYPHLWVASEVEEDGDGYRNSDGALVFALTDGYYRMYAEMDECIGEAIERFMKLLDEEAEEADEE